jgi:hypothetical protein
VVVRRGHLLPDVVLHASKLTLARETTKPRLLIGLDTGSLAIVTVVAGEAAASIVAMMR